MSRCGYTDDGEDVLQLGRWRAQVASASRGKRGQQFFKALIRALDALPAHRLIKGELQDAEGEVCALGALGRVLQIALSEIDTEDYDRLGKVFDIAPQLAQETMYVNDDYGGYWALGEERWQQVRDWAVKQLSPETLLAMSEGGDNGS